MTNPNPPPPPPLTKPSTYKIRYGIAYCETCDLAVAYCTCGSTPAADPWADGDRSSIAARIRAHKASR